MNFSILFSRTSISLINWMALFLVTSAVVTAQSSLNNPQLINKKQTLVRFNGDNKEQFLSFVGRGSVSVTLDVKATTDNAGVYVDFLNNRGNPLLPVEVVQAVNRGTDRVVKTISLERKRFQTVVLKLKSIAYGSRSSYPGELKITLNGNIEGLNGDADGLRENSAGGRNSSPDDVDFESLIELNAAGRSINSPKFLNTRHTILNFRGNDEEQFLGFTGQGEVEITYDVKAKGTNAGAYITLIDENGDELAGQEVVQSVNKGTSRITQSVELGERKLVIIKIVSIRYGSNSSYPGTLKITLNRGFVRNSE